jgi:hypothetical protein
MWQCNTLGLSGWQSNLSLEFGSPSNGTPTVSDNVSRSRVSSSWILKSQNLDPNSHRNQHQPSLLNPCWHQTKGWFLCLYWPLDIIQSASPLEHEKLLGLMRTEHIDVWNMLSQVELTSRENLICQYLIDNASLHKTDDHWYLDWEFCLIVQVNLWFWCWPSSQDLRLFGMFANQWAILLNAIPHSILSNKKCVALVVALVKIILFALMKMIWIF